MALNDKVAQAIMGEIDTITKQIDEQSKRVAEAAECVTQAAAHIKKNSEDSVKNAKDAAHQAQIECAAHFQVELSGVVAKTLNEVAGAIATQTEMRWVITGGVIAGVLTVVACAVGYSIGKDTGAKEGYVRARDEVAAVAWANTPEGRQAYQLAEAGSIRALATCDADRGWKLQKNLCVPLATKEGTYGWLVKK